MSEQYRPKPIESYTFSSRDYTQISDVNQGLRRLISGIREDGDETRMFELLSQVLDVNPEVIMPVICGSIEVANQQLNQNRRSGSSATLIYPIDAAIRLVAKRNNLFGLNNPDHLSAKNWGVSMVKQVLANYPDQVVDLAGNNTTSKNLPQRAAHILWLLDQCTLVQKEQPLAFIEIGASGGLVLDALKKPINFREWMQKKGYRTDYGKKATPDIGYQTLGVDLRRPDLDWLQAIISEDYLRQEISDFITIFDRSNVIEENATCLEQSKDVSNFLKTTENCLPVIFSCFVFYQLDEETSQQITESARSILKQQGGGLFIVSNIAKYRGFPEKAGGCASWVEDENGQRVSPRILLSKSTLTEWEIT